MALAAAAAWFFTLLLQVESPLLRDPCVAGEYFYSGICCKLCPAGTYVEENCYVPLTLGICKSCTEGENYTEFENGLQHCLPCDECKSGYKMITPCTKKKNTVCQCNDGYFCPQGCEECVKCKTRCPEGQVIIEGCSATTDMKCGPHTGRITDVFVAKTTPSTSNKEVSPSLEKPQESAVSSLPWIFISCSFVVVVIVISLLVLAYIKCKLRRSPSATKEDKEEANICLISDNHKCVQSSNEISTVSQGNLHEIAEGSNLGLVNREGNSSLPNTSSVSPSDVRNDVLRSKQPAVRIKSSVIRTQTEIYFQIKDMVGPIYWKPLMRRCGLSENDIDKISHDYSYQIDEQCYQMLITLRDRFGLVDALYRILDSLQEMKLYGIYENIINELKSKDIVTMEAED